jgi:multisubunit Na+/H+ antiporter MnhE subunit
MPLFFPARRRFTPARRGYRFFVVTVLSGGALFALWIALTDNTRPLELLVGGCCALLAGALLHCAMRLGDVRLRPRPRWLLAFAKVPWWALRDSVLVLLALARHLALRRPLAGRIVAVPFDLGDDGPRGRARRAIAFGAGSAGPNSYVIGASREARAIAIHQLVETADVAPRDALGERS